jgi:uncharacterized metal-binding protein
VSDGATHDKHGLLLAVLCSGAALALSFGSQGMAALLLPAGALAGTFLLSPDLDMWNTTPVKRWGPLRFLWAPYSALHKHRGLSHHPLIGPAGRLLYLAGLFAPAYLAVSGLTAPPATWLPHLLFAVVGVFLANWAHLLAD